MGISMSGSDAFSYNRFDALNDAYRSLYEEKEEKDEDEKEEKENPFKKKNEKDDDKEESEEDDDDEDKEESDDDEEESDDDEESDEDDEEKSDKKFPSFLKKSKGEDVKEEVIAYLMDEGFVNNVVSAEVMAEHMNPEWMEAILEGRNSRSKQSSEGKGHSLLADLFGEPKPRTKKEEDEDKEDERSGAWDEVIKTQKSVKEETTKFDERGRPKSGPFNVYQKGNSKPNASFDAARERVDAANRAKSPEQRKKELDAYKERQANR